MFKVGRGDVYVCAVRNIQLEFLGGVIVNSFAKGGILCGRMWTY
jgi:hypothetical protein